MTELDHGNIETKTSRMMTRREMILRYPPPYKVEMRDKHGRRVSSTSHNSLSALELEVQVALGKIDLAKQVAEGKVDRPQNFEDVASYEVTGIPKEVVLPKHLARDAP